MLLYKENNLLSAEVPKIQVSLKYYLRWHFFCDLRLVHQRIVDDVILLLSNSVYVLIFSKFLCLTNLEPGGTSPGH